MKKLLEKSERKNIKYFNFENGCLNPSKIMIYIKSNLPKIFRI